MFLSNNASLLNQQIIFHFVKNNGKTFKLCVDILQIFFFFFFCMISTVLIQFSSSTIIKMASNNDTTTKFFLHGNARQFDYVLKLYPQVLKVKAEEKKKPEELIKLDEWCVFWSNDQNENWN